MLGRLHARCRDLLSLVEWPAGFLGPPLVEVDPSPVFVRKIAMFFSWSLARLLRIRQ